MTPTFARRAPHRRPAILGAAAAVALVSTTWGAVATATPASGVVLRLPANATAPTYGAPNGVACASSTSCTAVGTYSATVAGNPVGHAVAWPDVGGTWGRGVRIAPPPGVAASDSTELDAVACTAPGTCVAVGAYFIPEAAAGSGGAPMLAREEHGSWSRAVAIALPTGFQPEAWDGLVNTPLAFGAWCAPAGTACTVAGPMMTSAYRGHTFVLSASLAPGAGWYSRTTALPAAPPPSLAHVAIDEHVEGLGCTDAHDCVVVGRLDSLGRPTKGLPDGFVQSESGGTWAPVRLAVVPADAGTPSPGALLVGAACVAGATPSCLAVGSYVPSGPSGISAPLVEAVGPAAPTLGTAPSPPTTKHAPFQLDGVSCGASGCTAIGADVGQLPQYTTVSGGTTSGFATSSYATGFPPVAIKDAVDYLASVSCPAAGGTCVGVGEVQNLQFAIPVAVPIG